MTDMLLLLSGILTGTVRILAGLLLTVRLLPRQRRLSAGWVRMALFVGIFYGIGVFFWQFLLGAWMGVLFRSPDFLSYETAGGQSALWLLNILLGGAAAYGSKNRERSGKSAFRAFSAVTLAGFLAVITLSEQTVLEIPGDTLYMWTILAVVLMMSVLVFNINRQYEVDRSRPDCWSGTTPA